MTIKLVLSIGASVGIMAALLFVPAGTLNWPSAWVTLGFYLIGTVLRSVDLSQSGMDLLRERLKPPFQRGQPLADKIVLAVLIASFYAMIVLAALDIFRFHLMPTPPIHMQALGFLLAFLGWSIAWAGLRENAFAASVVRLQEERRQTVVDTGAYSIVRHPIYAGRALLTIGLPLWLGSYAATIFALIPTMALIARIVIEEQLLKRDLGGYDDYTTRVRYRLIPSIW
ncbi:MAG: isoprenylcysteine carboxylmethyltransferase family protein [Candidatus Eremiobacteraeota bacterium]|nr:isoprenylcysteine carboxylmethyltransferase family protein [Candidatus Eremiobacteraeota bacterium]